MKTLTLKMWRELWHIRGQALAIALVIVGGIGVCVMSLSTLDSLQTNRASFYNDYRFAQIFANLKRAPKHLTQRLGLLPGVAHVETRVIARVNLQVSGFPDPVSGLLVSVPDHGMPKLNKLHLVEGRMPDGRRDNEVVVSDGFAEAHGLRSDDRLEAIINGRFRELRIVGVALSPEYLYQIEPGAIMPDYKRFGVMWMAETPLSHAYDMDGAFNDVVLEIQSQANKEDVIDQVDLLLEIYGGQGAYDREDQLSNRFLQEEFQQLETMSVVFPTIFLGVAMFLLNVVIGRLISTQKELIAVLKAFGYSNLHVAWHYCQMVLAIVLLGILGGFALGIWLGQGMNAMYTDYFRFPSLTYSLSFTMLLAVASITLVIAVLATLRAVGRAANMTPADAMRPDPPERFHVSVIERLGIGRRLSQPARMILRHVGRRPMKSALSVLGIAMAGSIMMVGNFQQDAVRFMMYTQFQLAQKQDLEVTFTDPVAQSAIYSLANLPGVEYAEGKRNIAVRLWHQQRSYRTAIQGITEDRQLQQMLDLELQPIVLPESGLVLSDHLAKKLKVAVGDTLTVEVLEEARPVRQVQLVAKVRQFLGVGAYMQQDALNRLLREGPVINSALLDIDPKFEADVYRELREMPRVAGINLRQAVIDSFHDTLEQTLLVFTFVNTMLGGVIAFGVIYNLVRIALAERARELTSLRVLGYTQGEVSTILFGELMLLTLLSIPLGYVIGFGLCGYLAEQLQSDLYRVPLVIELRTYAFSAVVVLVSALLSALVVWRRLAQLDMIEVLKTRE